VRVCPSDDHLEVGLPNQVAASEFFTPGAYGVLNDLCNLQDWEAGYYVLTSSPVKTQEYRYWEILRSGMLPSRAEQIDIAGLWAGSDEPGAASTSKVLSLPLTTSAQSDSKKREAITMKGNNPVG
jgi:hypothetical protein